MGQFFSFSNPFSFSTFFLAYCGIGCGNHSIISLEETLCRIGSIELSQYSLFVSNGAEETDRVYCFDVYFLYSTKKVDGDDEEKKTGDYLLIPGGVINCLDVFACTQSTLPLITLMLVLIQMLIAHMCELAQTHADIWLSLPLRRTTTNTNIQV